MAKHPLSAQPFEKIAISMSGGGYRAGAFHLGALSYLNRLTYKNRPLIENLKMISTVSGGSITGIVYAINKQDGKSFEEFYDFLLLQLKEIDLVKEGIEKLNPGGRWETVTKNKNLINAFSELYDKYLTHGRTLASLSSETGFETFVFNSTDFTNAIDFRFKNISSGYSGNFPIPIDAALAGEIKLSDIMASSSCFPGGFEPMIWPYDYLHEDAPNLKNLCDALPLPVGVMDGGIYDNQGIDAILNFKNGRKQAYFDLIIISDVASPYMPAYLPHAEKPKTGLSSLTVKQLKKKARKLSNRISIALAAVTVGLTVLPLAWQYRQNIYTGLSLGLAFATLVLLAAKILLVISFNKTVKSIFNKLRTAIPDYFIDRLGAFDIDGLSVSRLEPIVINRIKSLATLATDVFLKIVRRQNYDQLYSNEIYSYKRASNLVHELTRADFNNKKERSERNKTVSEERIANSVLIGEYDTVVSKKISGITELAANFGTTLWFTDKDNLDGMLESLVCAGEFTMCYNLLEYLEKILFEPDSGYNDLSVEIRQEILHTYELCKQDWAEFNHSPEFMRQENSLEEKVKSEVLEEHSLQREQPLNWNWPLRVVSISLPEKENPYKSFLRRGNLASLYTEVLLYPQQLINIKPYRTPKKLFFSFMPRVPKTVLWKPNIIVLNEGYEYAEEAGNIGVTADILIIAFSTTEDYNKYARELPERLQGLKKRYDPALILVFPIPQEGELGNWLNAILYFLQGGMDFIRAIKNVIKVGQLYYNSSQNWERIIEQSAQTTVLGITELPKDMNIRFDIPSLQIKYFTPSDLIKIVLELTEKSRNNPQEYAELVRILNNAVEDAQLNAGSELAATKSEEYIISDISPSYGANGTSIGGVEVRHDKVTNEEGASQTLRYLQARISNTVDVNSVITGFLVKPLEYIAHIQIGEKNEKFFADGEFPDSEIFRDSTSKVEAIVIHFQADKQQLQQKTILLPRTGNSDVVPFPFTTEGFENEIKANIWAYHKNRLIQWATLTMPVLEDDEIPADQKIVFKLEVVTKKDLNSIDQSREFSSSILVNGLTDEVKINTGKPITLRSSEGLSNISRKIKSRIELAAKDPIAYPKDLLDPNNLKLMISLAIQGTKLYAHFIGKQDMPSPIQLIAYRADFVPINFVYDFPPPAKDASFCPNAIEALKQGKCSHCLQHNTATPSQYICPLGFWGLRKVIEYHRFEPINSGGNGEDFTLRAEPNQTRNSIDIFENIIHGSSSRVDAVQVNQRENVVKALKEIANTYEPKDWEEWQNITQKFSPDSIVLIVHIQEDRTYGTHQIEIGEGKFLDQEYISSGYISTGKHPMAIVIGCESGQIDNQGFDIGAEFISNGASIVITNFTKIRGAQAADIVISLMNILKDYKGKEAAFGEIMLKLRQQLLAEGIMASLALLTYGDADWKIKINKKNESAPVQHSPITR